MFSYLILNEQAKHMNLKLLALVFSLFFCFTSKANHLAGGEITYKYLGSQKFDVTFKFYRDCRGGSLISPSFKLLDVNTTKELKLNASLVGIRDISNVCDTFTKKCNPSNKPISTSAPIFEEHVYTYQIDFNGNESSFNKVCLLKIGMGQCCRPSNLTTGGAGNDFWVTASLNLCTAQRNSSPVFLTSPVLSLCCNQPAYFSYTAADTIDRDSLSYSLTEPMQNWFNKVDWSSSRNFKSPLEDYWPIGYDKGKGANPNVNPPIGTYFDEYDGGIIFTPTNCSEITKLAIKVIEWRKDSTGKYKVIGDITRDIILNIITCPDNNSPLLYGPYKYEVCAGNQICFTITSDDKQFIPAPPKKPSPPDTVSLSWNNPIKNASLSIIDPKERLQKIRFCWTPKESDVSDIPHVFTVTAEDNHCPSGLRTIKSYSIRVKPIAKAKFLTKAIADNKVALESQVIKNSGTPIYLWEIVDTSGKVISNTNSFYFLKTKSHKSFSSKDTVVFRKKGTYFIRHTINYSPGNCPSMYFDTVKVPEVMDITFLITSDTAVCIGVGLDFNAKVINATAPYTFKWGKGTPTSSNYLYYKVLCDSLMELEVTDAKGQKMYSWCNIKLLKSTLDAGLNKVVCKSDSISLIAVATNFSKAISWSWFFKGINIGSQNMTKASASGYYFVEAKDSSGCFSKDSVLVTNFPTPTIKIYDSSYCQNKNTLNQIELIKSPSNINLYKNVQWQLLKTLKNAKGLDNNLSDLLSDLDTTTKYNFSLTFDKSRVSLGTKSKDSLIFSIQVTDSNKCKANDTIIIVIQKSPTQNFKYQNIKFCRSEVVDLDSLVNEDGESRKWFKVNEPGYSVYPLIGEVKDGIINSSNFNKQGGFYKVNLLSKTGDCETKGYLDLDVMPMPIPLIVKTELKDSVKFTDKSLYQTSRFWYLDTLFVSNGVNITLYKNVATGKSIMLRLSNFKCSMDTVFSYKMLEMSSFKNDLITIYPNPVTQNLTIEIGERKPYQLKVLNVLGQIVLQKDVYLPEETLDVANFSNGVYTLEISDKDIRSRLKFIKE
jgi:hypothetical protein